jgi:hypothetical protein
MLWNIHSSEVVLHRSCLDVDPTAEGTSEHSQSVAHTTSRWGVGSWLVGKIGSSNH